MGRTGRRPGKAGTREAILDAAREGFAAHGYDGVTIRQVAAAAAVDPALVHHYFHTKDALFRTALRAAVDPENVLSKLLAGPVDTLGERMVARFLATWEGGAGANASAMLRTAVITDQIAQLVREVVLPTVTRQLVDRAGIDPAQASMRTALIAAQLSGLAVARYLLVLDPIASATTGSVASAVGPTIQRYLTGPLPEWREPDRSVAIDD